MHIMKSHLTPKKISPCLSPEPQSGYDISDLIQANFGLGQIMVLSISRALIYTLENVYILATYQILTT